MSDHSHKDGLINKAAGYNNQAPKLVHSIHFYQKKEGTENEMMVKKESIKLIVTKLTSR